MMDHSRAKEIFAEIQARPYTLSLKPGEPSNNCYFKGIELLQRLAILGYAVRGRVGEIFWDPNIIPPDVYRYWPGDILVTHFYPEVMVEGEWRIVDPSLQPSLSKYGFTIGQWEKGGASCFPITKLYTQEESLAYQQTWFSQAHQKDFFERGGPFWHALNDWFIKIAKE